VGTCWMSMSIEKCVPARSKLAVVCVCVCVCVSGIFAIIEHYLPRGRKLSILLGIGCNSPMIKCASIDEQEVFISTAS
jgi:hypothetical protein